MVQLIGGVIATGAPGIGHVNNKQDYAYVENLVHGFLKLEESLAPGSPAAGKAYFITDNEPLGYFDFNSKFSGYFGNEFKLLPRLVPIVLSYIVETIAWLSKCASLAVVSPPPRT
jgi:sterol-4alpha-carboxylate 3-dehydrogenase (decarboxylating)